MTPTLPTAVRPRPMAVRRATRSVIETLERRSLMAANPVITEFVASNSNGLKDGNGVAGDWVEIQNQGDASINLQGWSLTDNAGQPTKWVFPSKTLAAGAYLVVFADSSTASGPDSLGYLHTNFSLSADGENLSLRRPASEGGAIVSQFGPNGAAYPKQAADVSYGTASVSGPPQNLIVTGAPAKATVATNGAIDGSTWTSPTFNDSSWKSGTTGVGFDSTNADITTNLLAKFDAHSIAQADGTTVQTWTASAGTGIANATSNQRRPTFVDDGINGMPALRFNGNQQLNVTNQSLNGATNFTVAVVFRTTQVGVTGAQWTNNTGLVDASTSGTTNDWGVSLNNTGQIAAGVGNPDTTVYSAAGQNNGVAHVAIFTKIGNRLAISIDGGDPVVTTTTAAAARAVTNFYIGALNGGGNRFVGDIGEVRLYNTGLSDDAVQSLAGSMTGYWGITPAVRSFTSSIGLDLKAEMQNVASSAYVRVPFTVTDTASVTSLLLKMKYDDGFVAYLNGTEIARRNAPAGTVTYASVATGTRPDAAALTAETIDVSTFANLLQGGGATNVLAVRALNSSAADGDLLIVPELVAANVSTGPAYMTTPTPGAANAAGYNGFAAVPTASVPHGYYTSPVSTTLTSASPGATLVYTTDGSTPTLANGTKVLPANAATPPSATLNVSSTTVLRMAAFKDGFVQSAVASASYLFANDIVQQPETKPSGAYWDVGLDGDVVNATQTYSVQQALVAVPTVSLTIDNSAMFGATDGIYTHPLADGDAWERPVSVEYFDPNNAASQLSLNAGIRVSGGVGRETGFPKKSFKLYFRSDYGASEVAFPFFGAGDPQTAFEHLTLRAGHNYAWANDNNYARGDYLRDPFARATQLALTGKASRNAFVQLYINGQYWGLYGATEDFDTSWAAANYGGNAGDYDIIKPDDGGGIVADDGNLSAWNELFRTTDLAYRESGISDAEFAEIAKQVDVPGLIDYMLNVLYRGDRDAPVVYNGTTDPRNFVAVHNHADPNGKIYFQTQDGEISLETVGFDRTELFGNQNPSRLWQQLRSNATFRRMAADRIQAVYYGNGPLTVANAQARYQGLMAQIDKAIVGESARWGNGNRTTTGLSGVGTRDGSWLTETNWILNTFMPTRTAFITDALKTDIPESALVGPMTFVNGSPNGGGTITPGSTVQIGDYNNPPGQIYYTLDGTDPRTAAGTLSLTAIAYTGQFTLPGSRTLSVRSLRNGVWSPLTVSVYTLPAPTLRLAEMMYHPVLPTGGVNEDDYEYLKIVNTGTTPMNLGGMTFTAGITGTIAAGVTLAPGAAGYVVRNAATFNAAYGAGKTILGTYTGALSNSSEQIRLFDPATGTAIFDFIYQDTWFPTTDGGGYALQVKDLGPSQAVSTVLSVATAWQAALASKPAGQSIAGDADGNGRVDFADFAFVQTAFGTRVGQAGYLSGADLNADGKVDFDDYSLVQANVGALT